jgi:AcrR family transcriptional regulator
MGEEAGGIRRQRASETEAALKRAAVTVFARVGYLNAKITDITTEAGRAAGSFYSHFAGKEALLEALLTDLLAETDRTVVADEGHSEDFADRAAIRWHVAAYWAFVRENHTVMTALQQAAMVDERFAARVRELSRTDLLHIADHLKLAERRGAKLPGDPVVLASMFSALLTGFSTWIVAPDEALGRELTDDEAIETLTSFIANALGAR